MHTQANAAHMPDGGGATVPGETPSEVPADNRDPGTEVPMPDGDSVPAPDTTSPTPAPTEVPQVGDGGGAEPATPAAIASNVRGNGGLGHVLSGAATGGSTEAALRNAAR